MRKNEFEENKKERVTPDTILDLGVQDAAVGNASAEEGTYAEDELDDLDLDEWEMNLGDAIQEQTILEQPDLRSAGTSGKRREKVSAAKGHAEKGRKSAQREPNSRETHRRPEGAARRAGNSADQRDSRRQEGRSDSRRSFGRTERGEDTDTRREEELLYDEFDEYEDDEMYSGRKSRRDRGKENSGRAAMSRRERKEYEEFLAYKEEQSRAKGRNKGKKKHHFGRKILILLLILLIGIPVLYVAARMNGIMEGVSTSDIKEMISAEVQKSQETGAMAGYTNIALFGLDSTEQSLDAGNNRTDVMIIASINDSTGEVKLVSVYRDTYLDIGDGNYQKANAAYAYGGPEQAIKMLNTNLDLNITDYATIGFSGVADMIDAVGGIEIDVQQDEIDHLNNYQSTMAAELGKEYVPLTSTGLQTLNGLQATAYCRIRYTDGGDFKRTERQKEVLSKTFAKLKSAGPVAMLKAADSLSSEVKTSLNAAEISALVLKALRMSIADTSGFPNEQYRTVGYIGDQSCVIPIHLTDNVTWLHQYLFEDDSYQVSDTVQTISNEISTRSGY